MLMDLFACCPKLPSELADALRFVLHVAFDIGVL